MARPETLRDTCTESSRASFSLAPSRLDVERRGMGHLGAGVTTAPHAATTTCHHHHMLPPGSRRRGCSLGVRRAAQAPRPEEHSRLPRPWRQHVVVVPSGQGSNAKGNAKTAV